MDYLIYRCRLGDSSSDYERRRSGPMTPSRSPTVQTLAVTSLLPVENRFSFVVKRPGEWITLGLGHKDFKRSFSLLETTSYT